MIVDKRKAKNTSFKDKGRKLNFYSPDLRPILSSSFYIVEPPESDYSTSAYSEYMDEYSLEAFNDFPSDEKPLIELDLMNTSNHQFFVLLRGLGGGKSTVALRDIRNYMLKLDRPAISFVHSRPMGEIQKEKFLEDSQTLKDNICRCVTYYHGSREENKEIRKSSLQNTLIITTPFMYAGTLTHFSSMISSEHLKFLRSLENPEAWQDLFETKGAEWAQSLMTPSAIFIDELDSFPLPVLHCLAVIVRLLIRKNPDLKVILASGTISNPDNIAELFFGPDRKFLPIFGTGRQGNASVDVFFEKDALFLLRKSIEAFKAYIQEIIFPLDPKNLPPDFQPEKCILFINNKLEIDIREIIGDFNDFFITLHGNMMPDEIANRMEDFQDKPLYISLVTTDIIHAGFDPQNVVWGIFYGLPSNKRAFIQRRHRIIRNPSQISHIDIIMRSTNKDEVFLAELGNENMLEEYVLQKEPPSFFVPLYTPLILQYAIAFGLVFGYWDVIDEMKYFINKPKEHPFFIQDLQRAYLELLLNDVIAQAPNGTIRPTKQTKNWICNFPKRLNTEIFSVIERNKSQKQKVLGRISFTHLQRHSLPGQTLPFIDSNYTVEEIDREELLVYVKEGIQEIHYYRNQIDVSYRVLTILAQEAASRVKLVEILKEEYISRVDRIKNLSNLDYYTARTTYFALFIPDDLTSKMKENISEIYKHLHVSPSMISQRSTLDDQLGKGNLLIDITGLHIAHMLYDWWIKDTNNSNENNIVKREFQ